MPFHTVKSEYGHHSIDRALSAGQITPDDAALITEYVHEAQAVRSISQVRSLKLVYDLVGWRRYQTVPWRDATIVDIHRGINALNSGVSKWGRPYSQNTKHDWIRILKTFCSWMIDQGYSDLPVTKIQQIRPPPVDSQTTDPQDLLSQQDISDIIASANTIRDRALIATLYETGTRISELARLTWGDVEFDDYGAAVTIHDSKTHNTRYSRVIAAVEYLVAWRNSYPGSPWGSAPVFVTVDGAPLRYRAMAQVVSRTAKRAGIKKRVHPHLFRKSRITHLIQQNYQESVIKKTMWGNINTDQFKTYAVLSQKDIDDEFLEKAGVRKKEVDDQMLPRQCDRCFAVNGPATDFCHRCGAPLSEEAKQKQAHKVDATLQSMEQDPRFARIEEKMEAMRRQLYQEISQEYKMK